MKKQTFSISFEDEGRLFDVLARKLGVSKKRAQALIDAKQVLVNGKRIWIRRHLLKEDDVVEVIDWERRIDPPKHLRTLWSDADYLVAEKPPYVIVNAAKGSLEERLREQEKNPAILAVHRLDKETSGCVLFARSPEAKKAMIPLFRGHDVIKVYRAVVIGSFPRKWTEIHSDLDGYVATTLVKVLDGNKHASYLELRIETGRTHQIRRHLADKRHPVLGDKQYAGVGNETSLAQPRQMLHAHRLVFRHPRTGETVRATAPLPADFRRCLKELKLR